MPSPAQSIVVWAYRRRAVVLAGALVAALAAGFGVRRVTFDTDVINLLPDDGQTITAFRTFLQRFGSIDQLLVVCSAPAGRAAADYADEVAAWVSALRAAPEIASVDTGTADSDRDWAWLGNRALLLMRGPTLDAALDRLTPDGAARALTASRQLLAVPSPTVEQLVQQDPLDFFGLLRDQLGGARAGIAVGITDAGYVTSDGRRRLIVVKPRRPPYDTAFSRALIDRLDRIREGRRMAPTDPERPPLDVTFAGGHAIALETEAQVKRESVWNSIGSLGLILPLLLIVFRSVWLFACGALPSLLSLALVLGALGLAGTTLSAAATGAAAMLFGLGVDGVVLMYVAYGMAVSQGKQGTAAVATLGGPAGSMFLGMLTTAATFYGLVFVDFPTLQQLGLLIGHSMVACGVLTLILIPALLPRKARRFVPLQWPAFATWVARRRGVLLWSAGVLTIVLGAAALRIRVNPSLERLRSTTPAARTEEDVRRMFALPSDVSVILQHGPDLDALLASNEGIVDTIRQQIPTLTVDGASMLLPSTGSQSKRRARLASHAPPLRVAIGTITEAAARTGFRPGALDPFMARLPVLLSPNQSLAFSEFQQHGLGDLIGRFVVHGEGEWTLASYAFPTSDPQRDALARIVGASGVAQLTGLSYVNQALAARFLPQFAKGLIIGSLAVVILVAVSFRDWRLSLLSTLPTILGLIWAAGLLALARVPLDLFAVSAVVSFVGIGIDYGIHLVHRYKAQGNAAAAVAELAPVIVIAGAITLFGYGTLVTSSYPPLQSMGVVSIVSIVALVAASVLVLPALLDHVRPLPAQGDPVTR